jgi:hypothetical protein
MQFKEIITVYIENHTKPIIQNTALQIRQLVHFFTARLYLVNVSSVSKVMMKFYFSHPLILGSKVWSDEEENKAKSLTYIFITFHGSIS